MLIIHNGIIVNEGQKFDGYIIVQGDRITKIGKGKIQDTPSGATLIDAKGGYVIPGVIDDQVHFREPGLTYKADIESESRAAAVGGVTSFMEMPNTVPQTTTIELLEQKFERAATTSAVNFSFYLGATNDNVKEITRINPRHTAGVKVFMGSSTGNMLVDRIKSLEAIFAESPVLVATHCEDEGTVQANIKKWGAAATISDHALIRSAEACYRSSALAVEIASKYNSRLHVLHLSTARELSLFESKPLAQKRITNEVCVHHLWFSDKDYTTKGNFIKWNPSIKTIEDRDALKAGLLSGRVDIVATDHAPHTLQEKERPYTEAPGGGPLVQHSLVAMLEMFTVENVVDFMCHRPSECFLVEDRGFLREGMFADIVVVEKADWEVSKENILYKCAWSPFEGQTFTHRVSHTIVNGKIVYQNGEINTEHKGTALTFIR